MPTKAQRQWSQAKGKENEQALWTQLVQVGLQHLFLADCQGDDTTFLPGRDYRADFRHKQRPLLVEVDGIDWTDKRRGHNAPKRYEEDRERDAEAIIAGFTVLRFTPNQAKTGYAIGAIERWIEADKERYLAYFGGCTL